VRDSFIPVNRRGGFTPGVALVLPFLISLLSASVVEAQLDTELEPVQIRSRCFDCHLNPDPQRGTERGPLVDESVFRKSVHGEVRCEGCHRSVVALPHEKELPPVDCTDCHRVDNAAGAPELKSYREFEESVHGRLIAEGDPRAPRCQNCHGGHDVLKPAESSSHVNKLHIASTCGHCHADIEADFARSIHGRSSAEGNLASPVCTDCHGEHSIVRPGESASAVSRGHVVGTCASCHDDIARMELFDVPTLAVESYRESYHGVAYGFGSDATATCIQCHGHHGILEQDHPESPVNVANIPATCGQVGCHEGAGEGFARGRVHVSFNGGMEHFADEGRDRTFAKVFHVTELAFISLTTVVIFGMILFMALDLYDKWVRRKKKWLRYLLVAVPPLILTFWIVWKVAVSFVGKLHA